MNQRRRAEIYRLLARLIEAGVPLATAGASLARMATDPGSGAIAHAVRTAAERGVPLSEALLDLPADDVPPFHARLLAAAEKSGDLPWALRALAAEDELQHANRQELVRMSAYPVLLAHLALFAPATFGLILDPLPTLAGLLAIALPLDLTLFAAYAAVSGRLRSPLLARLALSIPRLGRAILDGEHARYLRVTGLLYEAGIPIADAAREALGAVRHPVVAHQLSTACQSLSTGAAFREFVDRIPHLEPGIAAALDSAEIAGELGEALASAASLAAEQSAVALRRVTRIAGTALYASAIVYVAYRVISFWVAYYASLGLG